MAINPFQGPINYAVDVQSPFEAALSGFKIGAAGAEMQAQAQAREQKQQFQTGLNTFFKNPNRTYEDLEKLLPFADKQQFEALTKVGEGNRKTFCRFSLSQSIPSICNSCLGQAAGGFDDSAARFSHISDARQSSISNSRSSHA